MSQGKHNTAFQQDRECHIRIHVFIHQDTKGSEAITSGESCKIFFLPQRDTVLWHKFIIRPGFQEEKGYFS